MTACSAGSVSVRYQHLPELVREEQHNCLIERVLNTGLAIAIKPSTDRTGLRVVLATERQHYGILDMTLALGRACGEETRHFQRFHWSSGPRWPSSGEVRSGGLQVNCQ